MVAPGPTDPGQVLVEGQACEPASHPDLARASDHLPLVSVIS
jgi:hypothetical protein